MQAVDQLADVIADVPLVQTFLATIARVDDLLQVFDDLDDDIVVGQRAMSQVVDRADLGKGVDDPLGEIGKLLFETCVSGHGGSLRAGVSGGSRCAGMLFGKGTKIQRGEKRKGRMSG